MAGIYIHVPFCKQACHYCNFHFSTSLKFKDDMLMAIQAEIRLRKDFFPKGESIETIYLGGGTPSLLSAEEVECLLNEIIINYPVAENVECTIEANPDDLTREKIAELKSAGIHRLSIGVQAFRDDLLGYMNRAHNEREAIQCLEMACAAGFDSINADLIYGIPGLSDQDWEVALKTMSDFPIDHLSCYALTVEPKTALHHFIESKKSVAPDDDATARQFMIAHDILGQHDFEHYEISNYARDEKRSRHNTAYWLGKSYLGIGPAAHSFAQNQRSWNVANNAGYMKSIQNEKSTGESEKLSSKDQYNEYIMTGLRTSWGIDLHKIEREFGSDKIENLDSVLKNLDPSTFILEDKTLKLTLEGWLLSDHISSQLFS